MTNSTPPSPSSSTHSTSNDIVSVPTKTHSSQSPTKATSTSHASPEKWSFSALKSAAKRVAKPSMDDRSTSDGIAAMLLVQMSPAQLAAPPGASSATDLADDATSTTTMLSDMATGSNGSMLVVDSTLGYPFTFTTNIDRTVQVPVIAISQPFITTVQLVHYNRLLRILELPSSSLSSSAHQPVIDNHKLSKGDLEWIEKVKTDSVEQARIRNLVVGLVNEFLLLPFKGLDSIHEIVLVAPVLDKTPYQALLRCFLAEFDKQGILVEEMLQGLVQIVEEAPPGYLEVDNLVKILGIIRVRLDNTASQSGGLLFQLTQTLSRVLSVMADQHVKDLDRVKSHQPVNLALSAFKGADNPFLRFQAMYALQALRCVPDNETPVQCFFRHFVKVTNDVVQISRVMQMDFSGFVEGAVEIQKSIKDIYDIAKDGLSDFLALKEDGKSAIQALLGSKELSSWFICLRAAEDFAQSGRLVELSQCINEAPGHNNEYFQWGACQLLAEIAGDPSWDIHTRLQAVDYLGQVYTVTPHQNIKCWIFMLINYISDSITAHSSIDVDESIKSKAITLVQRFAKVGIEPFPFPYISRRRLPLPLSFALLQKVNKIPDIEPRLHAVRSRMRVNGLAIYVPLMCKKNLQASSTENLHSLEETVVAFLAGEREVLLILGDSGAGKSTFNRHLEHKLWSEYQPGGAIPLFIDLKAMGNLNEIDFVKKKLKQYDFEDQEIREVKRSRQVVLICDGYDECRQLINIHSRLKSDLGWKSLKLMITCRTQYLASMSDRIYFEPPEDDQNAVPASQLYDETVIVPFQEDQVRACIEQFRDSPQAIKIFDGQTIWSTEHYLDQFANLMGLVKNPFMLQIALRTLPGMIKDDGNLARMQLTRFDLYDKFTKQHFDNEKKRLSKEVLGMDSTFKRAFSLLQVNFSLHCMGYSKRLAHMVFVENGGVNSIKYSTSGEEQGWKGMFFGLEAGERITLLQQSSQLISYTVDESNQSSDLEEITIMHQFPHRSILEFLYSCQLCDHSDSTAFSKFFDTNARYNNLATCLATTADPLMLSQHSLNQQNIISESSILGFLVDHAKTNLKFQDQLNTILQRSKSDSQVSQAAANAITILVRAGVRFNNQDLQGIRINGANLTGGQFDGTQLQGADLRGCTLRNTWLRQADLSHADMENVVFGEWPFIQADQPVTCCTYSSNGKLFASGHLGGVVYIYDTSTWDKLFTFEAHEGMATSVSFSPNGLQLASTGWDSILRLWDTRTGKMDRVLEGHEHYLYCVAYSPNGKQLASAGLNKTIRLWDVESGKPGAILTGHTMYIQSVAYLPNGQQIVSGGDDMTVRLWDAQTGLSLQVLNEHYNMVTCAVFSPNGEQIASTSWDGTTILWNIRTGEVGSRLEGHTAPPVTCVVYSPDGQQVVTAGEDRTVRLWDAKTGSPGAIMKGHGKGVASLAYSPNGQQIASGSKDGTIRLWDTKMDAIDPILNHGQTVPGSSVIFSPNGQQIAACCENWIIQLWDTRTGEPGQVLKGHTGYISRVIYSPDGERIVSSDEDGTVRIWDAQTGKVVSVLNGHSGHIVVGIACSPNGQQIASASYDQTVRLWDTQTGELVRTLEGHTDCVRGVMYSPNGKQIASWGREDSVRLWDAETGEPGHVLKGQSGLITNAMYSSDGQHIISMEGRDGTMHMWDSLTGIQTLKRTLDDVACVAHSPTDQQVAFGRKDGELWLQDTQTGEYSLILKGHVQSVTSVFYSPNGMLIASASDDRTLQVWDVSTGVCLAVIGFAGKIDGFVWSTDVNGTLIGVVTRDNALSVCEVAEVEGQTQVLLRWTTSEARLHASNAKIQHVQGLSSVNRQLLEQRGAVSGDD